MSEQPIEDLSKSTGIPRPILLGTLTKEEAEKVATALENIQPAPEPKTPDEKPKEAEAKSPEKTTEKKDESDLKAEAEAMHQAECCIIL